MLVEFVFTWQIAVCGEDKSATTWYSLYQKGAGTVDQKAIGAFIAALRREKKWTQAELGEKLGVTNKTVSRWETGTYMPDLAVLPPLCDALEIDINELLSGRQLEDTDFRQEANAHVLDGLRKQRSLRIHKQISDACGGGGVGLLSSLLFSQDPPRKLAVAVVGLVAICVSWILRGRMDRQIFGEKNDGNTI